MICQQKNNRTLYHQSYHLIEKPVNTLFKIQMRIRVILEFFEKYSCLGITFFFTRAGFIRNPDVSSEQSCFKTTELHEDLSLLSSLFHFFYFKFSVTISFSLCFPISRSLLFFFLCFFSRLYQAQ